MPVARLL